MASSLSSPPAQSLGNPRFVVPWKSRKEFLEIYSYLFSEDESLQVKAIKRIATWKSRVGSKISVAIENTATLLENIINHNRALREQQLYEKESFLRAGYGLAILRFVNHVTEKGQKKQTAQPVHNLAREFGIPEWIVSIRHNATHDALPSLDVLSHAAEWAFQYLKEEFWDQQTHESSGYKESKKQGNKAYFRKLANQSLTEFQDLRLKHLRRSEEISQSEMSDAENKLKENLKENRFAFVNTLLEDDFLIPTAGQLEANFDISEKDIMKQQFPYLPPELREIWDPLITILFSRWEISLLAQQAMFLLSDEDDLRNHLLAAWLIFLLSYKHEVTKKDKKGTKKRSAVFQARKNMLSACLDNVNKFTIHFLKYLVDQEELGKEAYKKLTTFLRMKLPSIETSQNDSLDEDDTEDENVYTVSDIKEASFIADDEILSTSEIKNVQASVKDEGISWKICTDMVDWSRVPFGLVPSCIAQLEEKEEEEEDKVGSDKKSQDENKDEEDDDQYRNGTGNRRSREWKRIHRKRPIEAEDGRTSPKCATYEVNDMELL